MAVRRLVVLAASDSVQDTAAPHDLINAPRNLVVDWRLADPMILLGSVHAALPFLEARLSPLCHRVSRAKVGNGLASDFSELSYGFSDLSGLP
jgi:hypothetical protein